MCYTSPGVLFPGVLIPPAQGPGARGWERVDNSAQSGPLLRCVPINNINDRKVRFRAQEPECERRLSNVAQSGPPSIRHPIVAESEEERDRQ